MKFTNIDLDYRGSLSGVNKNKNKTHKAWHMAKDKTGNLNKEAFCVNSIIRWVILSKQIKNAIYWPET